MTPRRFRQGEHVCAIYTTREERDALISAYVAEGLQYKERCLYGALSRDDIAAVDALLERGGTDVDEAVTRGALVRLTPDRTHLVDGRFDAERMLRMLNDATEAALHAGFSGFRACGDMTWLADDPPGSEQAFAYEAFLNTMFKGQQSLGLCLYDRQRLPPHVIEHALATHSSVAIGTAVAANPHYIPSVDFPPTGA